MAGLSRNTFSGQLELGSGVRVTEGMTVGLLGYATVKCA